MFTWFWPIRIKVFRKGLPVKELRGKIEKQGLDTYIVTSDGKTITLKAKDYMIYEKGKPTIYAIEKGGTYIPLKIDWNNPMLKAIDVDWKTQHILEVRRIITKYEVKGIFEKYMPLFLLVIFVIAIVILFWGSTRYLFKPLSEISKALKEASKNFLEATKYVKSVKPPTGEEIPW